MIYINSKIKLNNNINKLSLQKFVNKFNESKKPKIGEFQHLNNKYITLSNVSHKINSLETDEVFLYVELEIINTEIGKIVSEIIKNLISEKNSNKIFNDIFIVNPIIIINAQNEPIDFLEILSFDINLRTESYFDSNSTVQIKND